MPVESASCPRKTGRLCTAIVAQDRLLLLCHARCSKPGGELTHTVGQCDARLVTELKQTEYDGVAIGGYINGQDAVNFPATEETTAWFNRVLNIVHAHAPRSKIILVRGPEDIVPAIERELGKKPPS